MAYSEAQKNATLRYKKKAYDQINVQVKKGIKEGYQTQAAAKGMSLNAYIIHLIETDMAKGEAPRA